MSRADIRDLREAVKKNIVRSRKADLGLSSYSSNFFSFVYSLYSIFCNVIFFVIFLVVYFISNIFCIVVFILSELFIFTVLNAVSVVSTVSSITAANCHLLLLNSGNGHFWRSRYEENS